MQGRRKKGGFSPPPPQFLADQLTLSQPRGGTYRTLSPPNTTSPPGFSDLATALGCTRASSCAMLLFEPFFLCCLSDVLSNVDC